ncbi:crossover junction endodeoxyribonuclease RuvC [Cytobacillus sp. FJAT-54145]|uniref:Crossover junction endodeoxyribonuclease RuvC n=1 Tax=Cytobacillus spartinae TaxID=3299023 RepID=A0ABW6KH28_9BACI
MKQTETKAPSILAIDASLTFSGIAITTFSKEIIFLYTIKTSSENHIEQRILFVYKTLLKIIEEHNIKLLLVENNYTGGSKEVNWVIGIIYLLAAEKKIPIKSYAPASIKKAVTGNGRANKKEIKLAIQKIYGDLKTNEHVRDALGLVHCYCIKKSEVKTA